MQLLFFEPFFCSEEVILFAVPVLIVMELGFAFLRAS